MTGICIGVFPPLAPLAEQLWAAIHEAAPLAWCIEAEPSRAGPWPRRPGFLLGTIAYPGDAHYAEVAALNPGLRAIAWGEL